MLEDEHRWRLRHGETGLEYFAPEYVATPGPANGTRQPLFYNYVFVHASELDIIRMKSRRPIFNFLRRVTDSKEGYFPYLSDDAMRNLRLVAEAYANRLPAYEPRPDMLQRGDRVRIVGGRFDGVEATLLRTPANARDELAVCLDDWMWVPVLHVAPGHYEIVELSDAGKSKYTALDNEHIISCLRSAIASPQGPSPEAIATATETALRFGRLRPQSDVLRSKHCAMMLLAYAVAGDRRRLDETADTARELLKEIRAGQSRALLLATLYGTTGRFCAETLAAVEPWRTEIQPKKSKRAILDWIEAIKQKLNDNK